MDEDEVTWQTILYNLVKKEGMDPWDVNVSQLAQNFSFAEFIISPPLYK
tara:strand:+ start:1352 stop:1498 length:147 start_codon:yes stop_codon:yes gene_type:complete